MSKIENGGLDQYAAEAFEQQQFGTAGVEGVKRILPWTITSNQDLPTAVELRLRHGCSRIGLMTENSKYEKHIYH